MSDGLLTSVRRSSLSRPVIVLPRLLDTAAAGRLQRSLLRLRAGDGEWAAACNTVELDGAGVEAVGTAALQVLVAMARDAGAARETEPPIVWSRISRPLRQCLRLAGADAWLGLRGPNRTDTGRSASGGEMEQDAEISAGSG